jgi:DNA invertase Pin-like site-specific DNA recombinase
VLNGPDLLPPDRRFRRARPRRKLRGCIYTRFSRRFQHSTADQTRKCREWAAANNVELKDCHIFSDEAVTGKTHKRAAFTAMLQALAGNEVDVVITFATNRLFRKLYRSLAFVEEEIVDRGKRCVFVAQHIDTDHELWRQLLNVCAAHDEMMVQAIAGQVRAAHEGLLLKNWVWGTLPFGYCPTAVEGTNTRLGRPRTTPRVDDEQKRWVLQVFRWFTDEGRLNFQEIGRRLREAKVTPPPRVARWTRTAVKYLLGNRRYVGDWSYGWTESVWQSKAGYSRQRRREAPRRTHRVEGLRIVPDDLFYAAQARLAERAGRGGRPSHKGGPRVADPLVEVCRCPKHNRKLSVCGANAASIACPACRAEPECERALFSSINRKVGLRRLCEALGSLVNADAELETRVVDAARRQLERGGESDGNQLADLEKELNSLGQRIRFALANPGETEQDQREQMEVLSQLRARRQEVQAKVELAKARVPSRPAAPSEEEIRQILSEMGAVLGRAAGEKGEAQEHERAMTVILTLTGGQVVLSQQGEARRKGGWLQGRFRPRLVDAVLERAGCGAEAGAGVEVVVDFRNPTEAELLADDAKALWDKGLLLKRIARELSARDGRRIDQNLVRKALDHWHGSRGLGRCPDGRTRRSELEVKHEQLPAYQQIAAEVGKLADEGFELQAIARRVGRDRNTIAASLDFWRRSQGLPSLDGRTRRKELPHRT